MQGTDDYAICSTALLCGSDPRLFGADWKPADGSAVRPIVPLLATIGCPSCRGSSIHLITHAASNEFLCGHCGCVMTCKLES
jgi:hypothetical protein